MGSTSYNQYRGWLDSKRDANNRGPDYTYTPAGRLSSRASARGILTSYTFNSAGDLYTVSYNDSITPSVTNLYDRLGRLATVIDGAGNRKLVYDPASGVLYSETNYAGILAGTSVTNLYNSTLCDPRRKSGPIMAAYNSPSSSASVLFGKLR